MLTALVELSLRYKVLVLVAFVLVVVFGGHRQLGGPCRACADTPG